MIPKIIHYCWYGRGEKSAAIQMCIESWRKYCPDWEIKEWNEDNFDITQNRYMQEAYEAKKWAFVSDYVRLKVLYDEGGIYLDTDVELIKYEDLENNLDEEILNSLIDADIVTDPDDCFIGYPGSVCNSLGMQLPKIIATELVNLLCELYNNKFFTHGGFAKQFLNKDWYIKKY